MLPMLPMHPVRTAVCVVLCLLTIAAQAQTLALTFDDGLDPDREPRATAWNRQLLDGLATAGIRSMIFPALARVGGRAGLDLVEAWSAAGHAVGNHTSRHRSLGSARVSLDDFIQDVNEGHEAFHRSPTWLPMLRFPYLKEGDTVAKRDGMRAWLAEHGYRPAPVSIDTSDWYFNEVWLALQSPADTDKRQALQREYVAHLLARADEYRRLARQVLKRDPKHVMLLHVNAINGATIADIAAAFRARNWTFVPPAEAFEDPLYRLQPDTLPAGESIVWALARQQGVEGLRYPAEDSVYEEPLLRAKGLLPGQAGR